MDGGSLVLTLKVVGKTDWTERCKETCLNLDVEKLSLRCLNVELFYLNQKKK